jgi:hypothetical protein
MIGLIEFAIISLLITSMYDKLENNNIQIYTGVWWEGNLRHSILDSNELHTV